MGQQLACNNRGPAKLAILFAGLLCLTGATAPSALECTAPPEYYRIELVPTRRVPAARSAVGRADVSFAPSPFGVAVSANGHYVYDLAVSVTNLPAAPAGKVYAVWITTPSLDQVRRLGALSPNETVTGRVDWNKFLVVISLEDDIDPPVQRWHGPIVMRGLSRSGLMHTSAGHGPFQQEPCATYGY